MSSGCTFALWQPIYAEHRIATFPLHADKTPMIRSYQKVGLRGSGELAFKFAGADAFAFMCGPRSRITVLDVDTSNERVLADALDLHGRTPVVVRTASGKWHVYYRHNGERRRIRPFHSLPIDILGAGGFAVAVPSEIASGSYRFVAGSLDDLDRLPTMHAVANDDRPTAAAQPDSASPLRGMREHDGRNKALFLAIAPVANDIHSAGGSRDALLDVALSYNQEATEPMSLEEATKIVDSVWRMTIAGRNHVGQHAFVMRQHEAISLIEHGDQDALVLLNFLRANHGPLAPPFWIANSLASRLGWTPKRLAKARSRLVEGRFVRQVTRPRQGQPAVYDWPPR